VTQNCSDAPRPDLDVFDFAPDLIAHAIQIAESDVLGEGGSQRPRPLFRRVPGPPAFRGMSLESPKTAPGGGNGVPR
jgi:hypothetical protein